MGPKTLKLYRNAPKTANRTGFFPNTKTAHTWRPTQANIQRGISLSQCTIGQNGSNYIKYYLEKAAIANHRVEL